jgi:hypothetical protein
MTTTKASKPPAVHSLSVSSPIRRGYCGVITALTTDARGRAAGFTLHITDAGKIQAAFRMSERGTTYEIPATRVPGLVADLAVTKALEMKAGV